jgi:hypothetical protein
MLDKKYACLRVFEHFKYRMEDEKCYKVYSPKICYNTDAKVKERVLICEKKTHFLLINVINEHKKVTKKTVASPVAKKTVASPVTPPVAQKTVTPPVASPVTFDKRRASQVIRLS